MQRDFCSLMQSDEGWQNFTAGWLVGGLSGVVFSFFLTKVRFLSASSHMFKSH